MMNRKTKDSERISGTWNRFFEMVRKTDSRRSRSSLEFYSRSAVPALLTAQASIRPEQL